MLYATTAPPRRYGICTKLSLTCAEVEAFDDVEIKVPAEAEIGWSEKPMFRVPPEIPERPVPEPAAAYELNLAAGNAVEPLVVALTSNVSNDDPLMFSVSALDGTERSMSPVLLVP